MLERLSALELPGLEFSVHGNSARVREPNGPWATWEMLTMTNDRHNMTGCKLLLDYVPSVWDVSVYRVGKVFYTEIASAIDVHKGFQSEYHERESDAIIEAFVKWAESMEKNNGA